MLRTVNKRWGSYAAEVSCITNTDNLTICEWYSVRVCRNASWRHERTLLVGSGGVGRVLREGGSGANATRATAKSARRHLNPPGIPELRMRKTLFWILVAQSFYTCLSSFSLDFLFCFISFSFCNSKNWNNIVILFNKKQNMNVSFFIIETEKDT